MICNGQANFKVACDQTMKKSSIAVTLVFLSPSLLIAGCNNRGSDENGNQTSTGRAYYPRTSGGGGSFGSDSASSPRGGFGSSGRGSFGGG